MVLKSQSKLPGGTARAAGLVSNLSIRIKILAGFGLVLAILAIVAANSYFSFTGVASDVSAYSNAAEEASISAKIETNFLKVRMEIREYANTGAEEHVKAIDALVPKLQKELDEARTVVVSPEHGAKVAEITKAFGEYMSLFTRMRAAKTEHDSLVKEHLFPQTEKIVGDLNAIQEHHPALFASDGDPAGFAGDGSGTGALRTSKVRSILTGPSGPGACTEYPFPEGLRVNPRTEPFVARPSETNSSIEEGNRPWTRRNPRIRASAISTICGTSTCRWRCAAGRQEGCWRPLRERPFRAARGAPRAAG